jgi:hypothetical protein
MLEMPFISMSEYNSKKHKIPATYISGFEIKPSFDTVESGLLESPIPESNMKVYTDVENGTLLSVRYLRERKKIIFVIPRMQLGVASQNIVTQEKEVASIENVDQNMLVDLNGQLVDLSVNDISSYVTAGQLRNGRIRLLAVNGWVGISPEAGSFEKTLWSNTADDCSASRLGKSSVHMSLSKLSYKGLSSMQLTSFNHVACTHKNFPIAAEKSGRFFLHLSYLATQGNHAQYYYRLWGGREIKDVNEQLYPQKNSNSSSWQSIVREVDVVGFDNIDMYLYAPLIESNRNTVFYDDVKIINYRETKPVIKFTDESILVGSIAIPSGRSVLSTLLSAQRQVEVADSFEKKLWTPSVEDCNTAAPGVADISMGESSDAHSGKVSLLLESDNHPACTHAVFLMSMQPDTLYKASVYYKVIQGIQGRLFLTTTGAAANSKVNLQLPHKKRNEWNYGYVNFSPKSISNHGVDVYLYADSEGKKTKVAYDTVSVKSLRAVNSDTLRFANIKEEGKKSIMLSSSHFLPFVQHFPFSNIQSNGILVDAHTYSRHAYALVKTKENSYIFADQVALVNGFGAWLLPEDIHINDIYVIDRQLIYLLLVSILCFCVLASHHLSRRVTASIRRVTSYFISGTKKLTSFFLNRKLYTYTYPCTLYSDVSTKYPKGSSGLLIVGLLMYCVVFAYTLGIVFGLLLFVTILLFATRTKFIILFAWAALIFILGACLYLTSAALGERILYVAYCLALLGCFSELSKK